ncbi:MAG: head GIN domain-containing protein, partial [Leeuwenhoekiella sp.]
RTFVKVYYKDLTIIDGNEGAHITANELLEQESIEIKAQEGARVEAGLEVDNVNIRGVTGGIIKLTGRANHQFIKINTGGIFEGKELHTNTTEILVQAGGEAEVHASKKVDVKVRAGGNVNVYGNPEEVNQSKLIGGTVKIMR